VEATVIGTIAKLGTAGGAGACTGVEATIIGTIASKELGTTGGAGACTGVEATRDRSLYTGGTDCCRNYKGRWSIIGAYEINVFDAFSLRKQIYSTMMIKGTHHTLATALQPYFHSWVSPLGLLR
jgi:hypothetical protein